MASMIWKGRFGVPYQGSKNQIAKEIISILPRGNRFVDLFAGGCAMTHAAMISGKYETFLANDIHGFGLRLFMDAIAGKCNGLWKEWVSREEFFAKRDSDPLIALCWSFGNNQSTYLYGKNIEDAKKREHEKAIEIGYEAWRAGRPRVNKGLEFSQLAHIERVQALELLQSLERVQATFESYEEYEHRDGDVVYCDPPYACSSEDNGGYRFMKRNGIAFDNSAFWAWVDAQPYPVFVSEYHAPSGFTAIWQKEKCKLMHAKGASGKVIEHVYVADRYAADYQTDLFLGTKENT